MRALGWLCLGCLSVGSVVAEAQDARKRVSGAEPAAPGPDWKERVIRATGSGAPDLRATNVAQARLGAEKAAILDAMRNLMAHVQGVRVDAKRTLGDWMIKDEVRARVEGLLRGYYVVGKRYFSDGGVEVDIEVPVSALTEVFDPDAASVAPTASAPVPRSSTGLVVDARGLGVVPALAPRILDGSGKTLYSVDWLSPESRARLGVAAYVSSVEQATKLGLVGDKPLVLKAKSAMGTDVILEGDELKKLLAQNTDFLKEARVVIVTH